MPALPTTEVGRQAALHDAKRAPRPDPITHVMAEYVERHAIAARLTAAVNDTISKLPDNPYGAMVRGSQRPSLARPARGLCDAR